MLHNVFSIVSIYFKSISNITFTRKKSVSILKYLFLVKSILFSLFRHGRSADILNSSVISHALDLGCKHILVIVSPPGPVPASISDDIMSRAWWKQAICRLFLINFTRVFIYYSVCYKLVTWLYD